MPGPVNSFTEWGPLREVIVGDPAGAYVPRRRDDPELSFRLFFHDNLQPPAEQERAVAALHADRFWRSHVGLDDIEPVPARFVEEREEDLQGVIAVLEQCGITVRRPARLTRPVEVRTEHWSNLTHPAHNVRDQVLIVGDEIIETPPLCRNRYFENELLQELFYEYLRAGARWTVAPRPTMRASAFDPRYAGGVELAEHRYEMMFDAAQCLRFGRDLLLNVATENHRLGALWLQRHLGERFRVRVLERVCDNHLDGMFLPLRPGTLLINPAKMAGKLQLLPRPLWKWDILSCEDVDETPYDAGALLLASRHLSVNLLSLDEERVLVHDTSTRLIRLLERHGFVPIPLRLRHGRIFGGGFHCAILDVRREEALATYL